MDVTMSLWLHWMKAVEHLRPACTRKRAYLWMVLVLMGFACRMDLRGVTSFVSALGLVPAAYPRLLHVFHSSAVRLDKLTECWLCLCPVLFRPVEIGSRIVCIADGIKAGKEGKCMPAVKYLHQESSNNTKPEYIMGHSFQAISMLVQGASGQLAAIPLVSRIHEGLVFSNRDNRTLLDKLAVLLFSVADVMDRSILLVADAYYASGNLMQTLLEKGHQLITRAKSNAVAYLDPPPPEPGKRGRPRKYGKKVRLKDLAKEKNEFIEAPSPVYGEEYVTIRYRCLDMIWRSAGRRVRFVIVHHPDRGTIFLVSTDLTLEPLEILALYGHRFKIELGFRQAVHVLGGYAYHFWMKGMKPVRRGSGNQHLHRATKEYREAVRRKLNAYHIYIQLACIAQGLHLHLALNHTDTVWRNFRGWLRTMNPARPPSELVVANALNSGVTAFFSSPELDPSLAKFLGKYMAHPPALDHVA
jgi:hypothetical protein